MTQVQVGKAVGVSRQAINIIENGKADPSMRLAFRLARFFKLNIEEIFLYDEEDDKRRAEKRAKK
jgi:putative transcriptional regulator